MNVKKLKNYILFWRGDHKKSLGPKVCPRDHRIVCFVAGKSGGHIIPCLTLADQYRAEHKTNNPILFTSDNALDIKITQTKSTITEYIRLPLQRGPKPWWRFPIFCLQLAYSFMYSFYFFLRRRPLEIVTTGGIIAIPVCLAGWIQGIPLKLYELNAHPGKAIKFLAPFAATIYYCYREALHFLPEHKCQKRPYPLRLSARDRHYDPAPLREKLGFKANRITLFILGGSQGSVEINRIFSLWLEQNPNLHPSIQVIHQAGERDFETVKKIYAAYPHIAHHIFTYEHNIVPYYALANLVICRAGAGTLFEILFFKKECIIIPLETVENKHQLFNAYGIQRQDPQSFFLVRSHDLQKNIKPFADVIYMLITRRLYARYPLVRVTNVPFSKTIRKFNKMRRPI